MAIWTQTGKHINGRGEKTIAYEAAGIPARVESRKVRVPHANGQGYWFHTTYFVVREDGTEKEYWRISEAKEAAERGA